MHDEPTKRELKLEKELDAEVERGGELEREAEAGRDAGRYAAWLEERHMLALADLAEAERLLLLALGVDLRREDR